MKKELIKYLTEKYGKPIQETTNEDSIGIWANDFIEIRTMAGDYPEGSIVFRAENKEIVDQIFLECIFTQEWPDVKQILELFGI